MGGVGESGFLEPATKPITVETGSERWWVRGAATLILAVSLLSAAAVSRFQPVTRPRSSWVAISLIAPVLLAIWLRWEVGQSLASDAGSPIRVVTLAALTAILPTTLVLLGTWQRGAIPATIVTVVVFLLPVSRVIRMERSGLLEYAAACAAAVAMILYFSQRSWVGASRGLLIAIAFPAWTIAGMLWVEPELLKAVYGTDFVI